MARFVMGKKVEKLPKLRAGWGGGRVVWAMPKTTGIFLCLRGLLSGGKVTSKNISAFTPSMRFEGKKTTLIFRINV